MNESIIIFPLFLLFIFLSFFIVFLGDDRGIFHVSDMDYYLLGFDIGGSCGWLFIAWLI